MTRVSVSGSLSTVSFHPGLALFSGGCGGWSKATGGH
jgi:hypothetical protein